MMRLNHMLTLSKGDKTERVREREREIGLKVETISFDTEFE